MAKKKKGGKRKRKIIPMLIDSAGAIEAGAESIPLMMAGDMEGALKQGADSLIANYTGVNVVKSAMSGRLEMEPWRLFIGYGPPVIRRMLTKFGIRMNWPF